MLITPQQVAIEVQRIEGFGQPAGTVGRGQWRWIAGKRFRGVRWN